MSTEVFKALTHLADPQTSHLDEIQTSNLMAGVEKVWDSLYPIERHRIMHLLIKKVVVFPNRLDVTLYPSGIATLVIQVARKPLMETTQ